MNERHPWSPLKIWFPDHEGPVRDLKHPFPWLPGEVALLNPALQLEHPETNPDLARRLVSVAACRAGVGGVRTLLPVRDPARLKEIGILQALRAIQPRGGVTASVLPTVIIERKADWKHYQTMKRALAGGPMALLIRPVEPLVLKDYCHHRLGDLCAPAWVIIAGQFGKNSLPCRDEWIDNLVDGAREKKIPVMVLEAGQGDWESRGSKNPRVRDDLPMVRLTWCGCNSSSDLPAYGVRGSFTSTDHKCDIGSDLWMQKTGWMDVPRQDWPMEFPAGWGPQ